MVGFCCYEIVLNIEQFTLTGRVLGEKIVTVISS